MLNACECDLNYTLLKKSRFLRKMWEQICQRFRICNTECKYYLPLQISCSALKTEKLYSMKNGKVVIKDRCNHKVPVSQDSRIRLTVILHI